MINTDDYAGTGMWSARTSEFNLDSYGAPADIPEVKAGDEVTLMGRDGEEFISVETLGDLSGRFSYEFVCGISKRVPRVYIKDGKECGEEESFFQ